MEVKVCVRCKEEKVVEEFSRSKSRKDGYQSSCKECYKEYLTSYRKENKEKIREKDKRYREENWDKEKERNKRYREENKEKVREKDKRYYEENKEKVKERRKRYYEGNKKKVREKDNRYRKKRTQVDELFKLKISIRSAISNAIKRRGYTKSSRSFEILGCSYEEFKVHIESMFKDGMSWENYGEWHLDHIIPISYGLNESEVVALNHFSNFQPLWAVDNMAKGNRYIG